MALIKCKECGKELSDQAESCPNCGYKLKEVEIPKVIVEKSNTSRTGTILCIVGGSLLLGFAIIVVIAMLMPSTTTPKENTSKSDIVINVTIGEEVDTNTQAVISYLLLIGIVSVVIIVLGLLYLKNKINKKHYTLYGISMLILSIVLSAMMTVLLNCCFLILFIAPILCFIGSIMILSGNVKEKKNEIQTTN